MSGPGRSVAGGAAGCLLALLAACSRDAPGPRHLRLAQGFAPGVTVTEPTAWGTGAGGATLHLSPAADASGVWVRARLPADAWRRPEGAHAWRAPRPLPGSGGPEDGSAHQRLETAAGPFALVAATEALADPAAVAPRSFSCVGDTVWALGEGDAAPGEATLWEYVDLGRDVEGAWKVSVGRYHAEGFACLPGFAQELQLDLPPGAALRFATCGRTWSPAPTRAGGRVTFEVSLDGEVLFATEQEVGMSVAARHHAVTLPPEGRRAATLRFAVLGDPAVCAFLAPVVGPAEVGDYRARPWEAERPDVVVFLADTFRADNMAHYGGDSLLTPHLTLFAGGALRFERAWSSSTWTLPSHATMFSGLFPYESGVVTDVDVLAPGAETIAERLRAAGYRTGAVTDHAFVSSTFGLAQGFEWFDEEWVDLADTLAGVRAFLDADDGRPVFLFVHTYRVHVPYRVSAATRERLGEHLGITDDWETLEASGVDLSFRADPAYVPSRAERDARRAYEALYRGAAADLDQGFEELRLELERRGLLDDGWLVFTSDHGEAFWEHGRAGHGHGLWEENVRIPLVIDGPGIDGRDVAESATLIDLPRTVAAMTGVPPVPRWGGADLLALDTDRPAALFECLRWGGPTSLALVEGGRKVIAPAGTEPSSVQHAYDLAADPREERDAAGADWPAELLGRRADLLRRAFERVLDPSAVRLDPEQREAMRALGYFGE